MLKNNVAEEARTKRVSSIVVEPKNNGSLRFRIDNCKLKAVTMRGKYSQLLIGKCSDSLETAYVRSTIDENSE